MLLPFSVFTWSEAWKMFWEECDLSLWSAEETQWWVKVSKLPSRSKR